jgi:hypothetical protein
VIEFELDATSRFHFQMIVLAKDHRQTSKNAKRSQRKSVRRMPWDGSSDRGTMWPDRLHKPVLWSRDDDDIEGLAESTFKACTQDWDEKRMHAMVSLLWLFQYRSAISQRFDNHGNEIQKLFLT